MQQLEAMETQRQLEEQIKMQHEVPQAQPQPQPQNISQQDPSVLEYHRYEGPSEVPFAPHPTANSNSNVKDMVTEKIIEEYVFHHPKTK